jgi:hypothetical protein
MRYCGLLAILCAASICRAQSFAIDLNPAGSARSQANAIAVNSVHGVRLGGWREIGSYGDPVLWSGSTLGMSSLMPVGFESSQVLGMSIESQVGVIFANHSAYAALWHGSSSSFVSLHPGGWHASQAMAVREGQQVGFIEQVVWGNSRAVLWHGSAESMVNLHPPQFERSQAFATDGVHQGGVFHPFGAGIYAAMWSGTAESFVNMSPPNSGGSEIHGMVPGVQVGFAYYHGMLNRRATVWYGTPESAVNINPVGTAGSALSATTGTVHVGGAWWGAGPSAALWLDTSPDNVINLASLLPPGYGGSFATGIVEQEGVYYISGYASYQSRNHAILWVVPAPGTGVLLAAAGVWALRRRR